MNVALLERVKAHILAEPRRFQMKTWVMHNHGRVYYEADNGRKTKFAKCGTAACIGGWAYLLSEDDGKHPYYGDIASFAREVLGLNHSQAARLFSVYNWPRYYCRRFSRANAKDRVRIAARRIDRFIKTKGAE